MKNAIRIFAVGVVLLALVAGWAWFRGLFAGSPSTLGILRRILNSSYFKIGNLQVTPLFFVQAVLFVAFLAVG